MHPKFKDIKRMERELEEAKSKVKGMEHFLKEVENVKMKESIEEELKIRVQGKSALTQECLEEIRQPGNIAKLRRATDPPEPGTQSSSFLPPPPRFFL